MKNLYFLAAALFCSTISAQNQISFETSEGYELGSIKGQNSWQITEDADGNFVENQVVSAEKFSAGIYSFKNGYTDAYGGQMFPIIGAQKSFDQPLDYNDTTISFDVLVTETDGSIFEMAAYGISADEEYYPVFDLAFDYSGTLHVITSIDYDMEDTGISWQPNQWYKVTVKVSANEIKYFIDGTLIYTTPNFTQINLEGMNFLHDNYGGDAYIDNIKINEANMAVSSVDYDMDDTGTEWQSNQWYSVVVKVSTNEIKYFIDGTLIYTTPNFTQINLLGMNFLHDNYGGDAYIDNIKINETNMSVSNVKKGNLAVYPNPVKNSLNFNLPHGEAVSVIRIHNIAGQTVIDRKLSTPAINLEPLKAGAYIITVTTNKGTSYSSKFIKE